MKHIVTVVCDRDKDAMLLQAESIQRYLDPCTHIVVINEENSTVDWQALLSPYYTSHKLKFWSSNYWELFTARKNGWILQQLYKLEVAEIINEDYLILDSKNFFIKHTNLSEWKDVIGSGRLLTYDREEYINMNKQYSEYFNLSELKKPLLNATPFKVDIKQLKKLKDGWRDYFVWCYPTDGISEFIFYSYLVHDLITNNFNEKIMYKTYWQHDSIHELTENELNKQLADPSIKVLGFHRFFLRDISNQSFKTLNNWLEQKGWKNRINRYSDAE